MENSSGLASAQSKFALNRTADRWSRLSEHIPTTHNFKPAIPGIAHHDLNEHLCLQAAQRLGLLAASSELARFDDERVFVVERYGRPGSMVSFFGCTRSTRARPSV